MSVPHNKENKVCGFNKNRSCIEIKIEGTSFRDSVRFNKNRSCIEIRTLMG